MGARALAENAAADIREPEVVTDPDLRLEPFDPRVEHRIVLLERHAFTVARCAGCGWESFARRSRPLARREGRDHVLLYGG